ncbi:MAG: radical SAM protein [bacterium]|nr:radical SAM protein [bacterium]
MAKVRFKTKPEGELSWKPTVDPKSGREEFQYLSTTSSMCFECVKKDPNEIKIVDAEIYLKNGKIFLKKFCKEHGHSYALKCSDADWYFKQTQLLDRLRPGMPSGAFQKPVKYGCPWDCGLCPDHHQHTCVPVIDITGRCDMACPVCDAQLARTSGWQMSPDEYSGILDMAIKSNPEIQAVALSGGEPALHPKLFDFIEATIDRGPICRIDVLTGGIRIANDEAFVEKLAAYNPHLYINLQFDGFSSKPYEYIRGKNYLDMKLKALEHLERYEINTVTQSIVAKGVNEEQPAKIITELAPKPFTRGFIFQPLLWANGAPDDVIDPMDRMDTAGIIKSLEEGTNGLLVKDDFIPSPCPHPECQVITYLWVGKKIKCWLRAVPKEVLIDTIQSEPLLRPEKAMELVLNRSRIFATGSEKQDPDQLAEIEKQNKFVNIHHYMDPHDFDLGRLKKCCQHMPTPAPDQKLIPVCLYNIAFRSRDQRWVQ